MGGAVPRSPRPLPGPAIHQKGSQNTGKPFYSPLQFTIAKGNEFKSATGKSTPGLSRRPTGTSKLPAVLSKCCCGQCSVLRFVDNKHYHPGKLTELQYPVSVVGGQLYRHDLPTIHLTFSLQPLRRSRPYHLAQAPSLSGVTQGLQVNKNRREPPTKGLEVTSQEQSTGPNPSLECESSGQSRLALIIL